MSEIEKRFGIMDHHKGSENNQIIMPIIDVDRSPVYVEPIIKSKGAHQDLDKILKNINNHEIKPL
jgi:hypothetical protein